MKNLAILLLACSAMLFAFSCKDKDDDATTRYIASTDYFPLTQGSYWIYHWVKIDEMGNETAYNKIDTVRMTGEEVLNGFTYAKMEGTNFGSKFEHLYRDSNGYMVEASGGIPLFSIKQGVLLGQDTTWGGTSAWFWVEEKMKADLTTVAVTAGTFHECLSKDRVIHPLELQSPVGVRTYPHHYAQGIGLVKHLISFYSSPEYFESRLEEYHIE